MRRTVFLFALLLGVSSLFAQVRMPRIFGDHMVLQRDQPIMIWGWSSPREKVTVQFDKQLKKVTAGKDGKWKLALDPVKAGGPFQLIVKGKNALTFNDVLVGEVWLCSGQSNMAMIVRSCDDASNEIANANDARIRHIKVPTVVAGEPAEDIGETSWMVTTPENVPTFTAVGYFFARELIKEVNVPIGLINTSWGGTIVETWTSREAFAANDEFRPMIASVGKIDLDSLEKSNADAIVSKIKKMQGSIPTSSRATAAWKESSFHDASWPQMNLPGTWERRGLGNIDGVVWFRKSFTVQANAAGKEAVLTLGTIDDQDETYVNGVRIGGMMDDGSPRSYRVKTGILREGENIVAVRVEDTAGNGGFSGQPSDMGISVAGTRVSLAGEWRYQVESLSNVSGTISPNQFPTLLYNAMIHPLIPYTIRGALWYQGESNAGRAHQYREAFPLMIKDWRSRWGLGDFPFYFVQLATYNSRNGNSNAGSTWAELREAQTRTLSLPNTGMAVTTDIGNPSDIHPTNKQDVGRRLAAIALDETYGKDIVSRGPTYQSMKKQGSEVILSFSDVGGGLMVKDKYGYLKGFEVAGADRKFYYAQARIDGDKVIVSHPSVTDPVAVRFGWADDAGDCNLYNKEGFPAGPFRTDDWKGITEESRYNVVRIVQ